MSKAQEAQQFLQDLDAFEAPAATQPKGSAAAAKPGQPGEAADVIAFLDEITQKSSEPTRSTAHLERPTSRAGTPGSVRKTERVRMTVPSGLTQGTPTKAGSSQASASKPSTPEPKAEAATAAQGGGWGWGSVWSSASAAIQQAKSVVDEQVKQMPSSGGVLEYAKNAQEYAKTAQEFAKTSAQGYAKSAQEYAKTAQLDKLGNDIRKVGLSTLTDILNVVAPPISDHEVIQIWLSHDMEGYEGVENVVYKALARIMEQVEGGDLIVNRGDESKPKPAADAPREMHAADDLTMAIKLAQAEIQAMSKVERAREERKATSVEVPTTYSDVYLRVQPFKSTLAHPPVSADVQPHKEETLQFLLHLTDPGHKLVHSTVTQAIPRRWLDVWDTYDWVEDTVVDVIRQGVEVLGQDYIARRMSWLKEEAEKAQDDDDDDDDESGEEEESDEE